MSASIAALAETLSPPFADQLDEPLLYHDPSRGGFVSFLRLGRNRGQRAYHLSDLERGLAEMRQAGNDDIFIAQNEFFRPNRRLVNCSQLTSLYLDLDTYRVPALSHLPVESRVDLVDQLCHDRGLPLPSLVVHSGRGLQLKWLLEKPLPSPGLPRWRATQHILYAHFAHLGADPKALDASRVLRLVGSKSSRTGDVVRVVRMARTATMGGVIRAGCVVYPFDELARTLLPLTREELARRRADWEAGEACEDTACSGATVARPRHRTNPPALGGPEALAKRWNLRLVPAQLAWDRLHDLRTIARLRGWERGAPSGDRNAMVFLAGCFLAHVGHVTNFNAELREFAREVAPTWTDTEIRSCTASVNTRMQRARAGETVEYSGKAIDPRYRFTNASLIELLSVTEDEQRRLRTIVSRQEAQRRDRERKKKKREQNGQMPRGTYALRSVQRAERAKALAANGMHPRDIAAQMGCCRRSKTEHFFGLMPTEN